MIDIVATVECAGGVVFHPVFTVRKDHKWYDAIRQTKSIYGRYAYLCGYRIR